MAQELNAQTIHHVDIRVTPDDLMQACLENGFAFALYRLPHADVTRIIVDFSSAGNIEHPDLEELEPGFLFAPFRISKGYPIRHIRAHVLATVVDGFCHLHISPRLDGNHSGQLDSLLHTLKFASPHKKPFYARQNGKDLPGSTNMDDFKQMVSSAVAEIRKGSFQKVVPARNKSIRLPDCFNMASFFRLLTQSYPAAMVYLVSTPETGSWIGATPELLLSIDKEQMFSTSALAGTQPYRPGTTLDDAAWKHKEIEEQAMVSRYIINCFKRIRLREFEEIGPKTVKAGNLIHLETRYNVNMREVQYPQLGTVMLELLHPTSATCGMPKEPAMQFLQNGENFERAYFSGYLGPVHIDYEIWMFVNLRCMQLLPDNVGMLYSGAGVTAHSDPDKEWTETRLKMKTLKDLLEKCL